MQREVVATFLGLPEQKISFHKKIKREGKTNSKDCDDSRIGFTIESAHAVTAYKIQEKNEKCAKIVMKGFAHVPGLFLVSISRVCSPKDRYIPEGMFPTTLDVNLQRLNPLVIEAEIFERVVKITSLKTLCKYSIKTGKFHGQSWNQTELDTLND